MKKIDCVLLGFFFLLGIISRLPFIENFQSHWDGPQYTIAIVKYSLEQQTPGAPGYPLYIALGRLFYTFTHNPYSAILLVSVFGAGLGTAVFYFIGKSIFNRKTGIAGAIIFLTGSTFYYFGLTPYAYGLLPATSSLLAYVLYIVWIKKEQKGFLFGLICGICFGLRPQEFLLIGPMMLFGFFLLRNEEKVKAVIIATLITLCWFIPISALSGGVVRYFITSYEFSRGAFPYAPLVHNIDLIIKGFLLSFGLSGVFLLYFPYQAYGLGRKKIKKYAKHIIFFSFWIIPGFLFNLFIRTDHAGYQMTYLSGFLVLISAGISIFTKKRISLYIVILIIVASFNLYWFFYNRDPHYVKPYRPTSFHYSDIRKNDIKVGSKVNYIEKHFDPNTTLILSSETLWRPYSYHLKHFLLFDLARLDISDPRFMYLRHDTKNWVMREYFAKSLIFAVPSSITTIVFTDDNANIWLKNYSFETVLLPGRSTLTIIKVEHTQVISYNYHTVYVISPHEN